MFSSLLLSLAVSINPVTTSTDTQQAPQLTTNKTNVGLNTLPQKEKNKLDTQKNK